MMDKSQAVEKAVRAAIASPWNEICGYIIKTASGGFDFYECENIAMDPMHEFEISIDDSFYCERNGEIVSVVHSHPGSNHLYHLSAADRISQWDNLDPEYILIKPDFSVESFQPIRKFRGRDYVMGVSDCYSVMQDYYAMCGKRMKDYDRNEDWWDNGKNLYLDNIELEGFTQVEKSMVKPGDTMLFCYSSNVPNHCGIYIGENQFIHHMTNRKSKIDNVDRFWFKFCHSVWRDVTIPTGITELVISRIRGEIHG